MCVCVCALVCAYVLCMYVYMYVCIYICMYARICRTKIVIVILSQLFLMTFLTFPKSV